MADRHIWVVEMKNDETGEWEPTVGCCISRNDGRNIINNWRIANPHDAFRLTKYVAEEKRRVR